VEVIHVETPVRGRVVVVRRPVDRLIVGFHGYGETALTHSGELEKLPGIHAWSTAAVQALHPFYTRSGEVVASWMTSLDRELAIEDNLGYVSRVLDALPARTVVFAGFSQGAAMAYRAAAHFRCAGLIVLGGDVPPDADVSRLPPTLLGRGRNDDWFTVEKLKKDLSILPGGTAELFEFDGGHEWTDAFRGKAGEFLRKIAE
jgi:predicted esterase